MPPHVMPSQTAAALPVIESDRPAATAALLALARCALGTGAWVREGTVFRIADGEISVHRAGPDSRAALIALPAACLPPTAAFRVDLVGGRFEVARAPDGPTATAGQERAFASLIALYNALEKPRQWARQSPWLTLWDDPALLGHLVSADRPFGRPPELTLYHGRAWARLLAHSFMRARAFALRQPGGPARQVLLPLMDALDHHAGAGRFTPTRWPGPDGAQVPVLTVPQARPVSGSDACRVAYNVLDAQQSLLHYGFLDESAAHVLSVPMRLPLGGGAALYVLAATGRYADPLPRELEPLRAWMPRVLRAPPEVLAVTRVPLPPAREADRLHAVLETLIARRWPDWSNGRRGEAARAAARALFAANRRYHARTAHLVAAAHARSGRGDVPGRRATLAALDRMAARAQTHFAAT